jgi:MFS transporter, PPP family, 3-phenylpropionic acid transporter
MPVYSSCCRCCSLPAPPTGRYGRMRLWGSIGFLLAVTLIGPLLDVLGTRRLPQLLFAITSLLLIVVWFLPEPPDKAAHGIRGADTKVRAQLLRPAIALFFASAFLMMFAHAALYAFFSLYLEQYGYTKTAIGLIWAIGVVAEIVVFRVQRRLFERFGAALLLSASLLVAAFRFALIAMSAGLLLPIVFAQLLHAITFGVHHSASMAFLQKWFAPHQQARAQAVFITIAYGFGGTMGGLAASALWTRIDPPAAFFGAALAGLAAWAVFALSRRLD